MNPNRCSALFKALGKRKFCGFYRNDERSTPIWINPKMVTHISGMDDNENVTLIRLSDGTMTEVKLALGKVLEELENSNK